MKYLFSYQSPQKIKYIFQESRSGLESENNTIKTTATAIEKTNEITDLKQNKPNPKLNQDDSNDIHSKKELLNLENNEYVKKILEDVLNFETQIMQWSPTAPEGTIMEKVLSLNIPNAILDPLAIIQYRTGIPSREDLERLYARIDDELDAIGEKYSVNFEIQKDPNGITLQVKKNTKEENAEPLNTPEVTEMKDLFDGQSYIHKIPHILFQPSGSEHYDDAQWNKTFLRSIQEKGFQALIDEGYSPKEALSASIYATENFNRSFYPAHYVFKNTKEYKQTTWDRYLLTLLEAPKGNIEDPVTEDPILPEPSGSGITADQPIIQKSRQTGILEYLSSADVVPGLPSDIPLEELSYPDLLDLGLIEYVLEKTREDNTLEAQKTRAQILKTQGKDKEAFDIYTALANTGDTEAQAKADEIADTYTAESLLPQDGREITKKEFKDMLLEIAKFRTFSARIYLDNSRSVESQLSKIKSIGWQFLKIAEENENIKGMVGYLSADMSQNDRDNFYKSVQDILYFEQSDYKNRIFIYDGQTNTNEFVKKISEHTKKTGESCHVIYTIPDDQVFLSSHNRGSGKLAQYKNYAEFLTENLWLVREEASALSLAYQTGGYAIPLHDVNTNQLVRLITHTKRKDIHTFLDNITSPLHKMMAYGMLTMDDFISVWEEIKEYKDLLLLSAILYDNVEVLEFLFENGADLLKIPPVLLPSITLENGIDHSAAPHSTGHFIRLALMNKMGSLRVVSFLFQRFKNLDKISKELLLSDAIYSGSIDNIQFILQRGAKIQPVHFQRAFENFRNNPLVLDFLLEQDSRYINEPVFFSENPMLQQALVEFMEAPSNGDEEMEDMEKNFREENIKKIEILLKHGAKINGSYSYLWRGPKSSDRPGDRPDGSLLHQVCASYNIFSVVYFNSSKKYSESISDDRVQYRGSIKRLVFIIEWLLDHHIDPNHADTFGTTPLHMLANDIEPIRAREAIKLLLDAGANINQGDKDGKTPLHTLVSKNNPDNFEIIKMFVEYGTNLNQGDKEGITPLMIVAANKDLQCTQYFLQQGAHPNQTDKEGNTPLHLAAKDGSEDVVKVLLEYGADKNKKNKNGQTPKDVANEEVLSLFQE